MKKFVASCAFLVCLFSIPAFDAHAANVYWVATSAGTFSSTTNWSTSSGGSSGASIPGASDIAVFDGAGGANGACTIYLAVNVAGINIAGYTGTITQSGFSVTVGSSNFNQSSGTFSASGALFMSGNTSFTVGGTGVFNGGTGSVNLTGGNASLNVSGASTLNDLSMNLLGNFTLTGTTPVNGNLTITRVNSMAGGTLAVSGNVGSTAPGTSTPMDTIVLFTGAGAQTFSASGGSGIVPAVQINKSGGSLTVQDTIHVRSNWIYAAGTVNAGTSTVIFDGGSCSVDCGAGPSMTFGNVTFDSQGDQSLPNPVKVAGDFSIKRTNSLSPLTNTIFVGGNLTTARSSGSTPYNANIELNGTGAQTISQTGGGLFPNGTITINKASGVAALASNLLFNIGSENVVVKSATLDLAGFNLTTLALTVNAAGILQLQGSETVSPNPVLNAGSTVLYNGTSAAYTLKNYTYSNLKINGGATSVFSFPANLVTINTLTLSNSITFLSGFNVTAVSFVNQATLRLQGNEAVSLPMDTVEGLVEYVGRNLAETLTLSDFGATDYFNLSINDTHATPATFQTSKPLAVNGTLTITAGTFIAPNGASSLSVAGNFNHAGGTFTHNSGTLTLNGAKQSILGSTTFNNLSKTVAASSTLTFQHGTTQTVGGTLTLLGASGQLLNLRSDLTGSQWLASLPGTRNVSFVDVQDGSNLAFPVVNPANSVDSGNNNNWFKNGVAITWNTPSNIVYGTPLSGTQLNATASVPGTFSYAPPAGTVLGAGAGQVLTVTFTPTDLVNYKPATSTVLITVLKNVLTVTADPQTKLFGDPIPTLTATISGFVNGDTTAVVSGSPALSTAANSNSPVGTYPIIVAAGSLSTANYSFAFVNGTLSITPRIPPAFPVAPVLTPNPSLAGQQVIGSAFPFVPYGAATVAWNFGDGATGTGTSIQHTWQFPGIYDVVIVATGSDGLTTTVHISQFVGSTAGAGGTPPDSAGGGIIVGDGGLSSKLGRGKMLVNFSRYSKTTVTGFVSTINLPASLKQSDLTGLPGYLTLGQGSNAQTFLFFLGKSGSGSATSLRKVAFSIKKKAFSFSCSDRAALTDMAIALGATYDISTKKGARSLMSVPATVSIGSQVYLAMTFRMHYQQVGSMGKGDTAR